MLGIIEADAEYFLRIGDTRPEFNLVLVKEQRLAAAGKGRCDELGQPAIAVTQQFIDTRERTTLQAFRRGLHIQNTFFGLYPETVLVAAAQREEGHFLQHHGCTGLCAGSRTQRLRLRRTQPATCHKCACDPGLLEKIPAFAIHFFSPWWV